MQRTVGCFLIAALALGSVSAWAADQTIAEQVSRLKAGRKIKVQLTSGETVKGRMGTAAANQFTLELNPKPARAVLFSEVRSIQPDGMSTGLKWAIFGVVWVVVAVVAKAKT